MGYSLHGSHITTCAVHLISSLCQVKRFDLMNRRSQTLCRYMKFQVKLATFNCRYNELWEITSIQINSYLIGCTHIMHAVKGRWMNYETLLMRLLYLLRRVQRGSIPLTCSLISNLRVSISPSVIFGTIAENLSYLAVR